MDPWESSAGAAPRLFNSPPPATSFLVASTPPPEYARASTRDSDCGSSSRTPRLRLPPSPTPTSAQHYPETPASPELALLQPLFALPVPEAAEASSLSRPARYASDLGQCDLRLRSPADSSPVAMMQQHNGLFNRQHRSPPSSATHPLGTHGIKREHAPADVDSDANSIDENEADQDDGEVVRTENGKRKRPISVSCELCKQRKVKCDRGQPSCGWCSRNRALCEYKERKKPGLRAGYGRELEQRLDKLEEILRSHAEIIGTFTAQSNANASASTVTTANNAASSVRNSVPSNPSVSSEHGTPRDAHIFGPSARTPQAETALFLQKPASYPSTSQNLDFGLPPKTLSGPDNLQHLTGTGLGHSHASQLPSSSSAQEFFGTNQPLGSPTVLMQNQSQAASFEQELPPYDLLYALVDLYFKQINTWCPILHKKTTLERLFGPSKLEETDRILMHAIVATTLRYSNDPRLTAERRQHYHDVSKRIVLLYGMENSSVEALQALVVLALDLCGTSNGPPSWNIMALITRSVVQLGLSTESTSLSVVPASIYTLRAMVLPEPHDFVEEESRRRLFWMVYLLDRYATIATAFDFALDDKEIDRVLPCREDLWMRNEKVETRSFRTQDSPEDLYPEYGMNRPENMGSFAYYLECLGILSNIHKFLKQPVDINAEEDVARWQERYKSLSQTLARWKLYLPGDYNHTDKDFRPQNKNLNPGWIMLHATYHTAVIRLHSSAAYPTTRSAYFVPSYNASQLCTRAVEEIRLIGELVRNHGYLTKLGPPFAFTLWVAARLLLVHGSTIDHNLSPHIKFFVETLSEMGHYWPVAARYSGLLQRVLDEHAESERQGDGETPSSVTILADMRRTAFDLDFLISRQPKHDAAANNRMPSVTPSRTPQPNELEYHEMFGFFNMPRLQFGTDGITGMQPGLGSGNGNGNGHGGLLAGTTVPDVGQVGPAGEFNITNFIMDASSDWFPSDGKFGIL